MNNRLDELSYGFKQKMFIICTNNTKINALNPLVNNDVYRSNKDWKMFKRRKHL